MKLRKISSLLVALAVVLSLAVTAFAMDSTITYSGRNKFDFAPGSWFTTTDLFDGFKNVMPGDVRTETITITNTSKTCDFVRVYMQAQLHDEQDNPLSPNVARVGETVASMSDFLSQMDMTVVNKSRDGETVFDGKPSQLDGLENRVYLGSIRRNKSITLEATLFVPASMGNDYANREGEVDWIFTVEEFDDSRPDTPKTGDETDILPYILMLAVGVAGMVILLVSKRRHRS